MTVDMTTQRSIKNARVGDMVLYRDKSTVIDEDGNEVVSKDKYGKVFKVTPEYVGIQFQNYKECFLKFDLGGRYNISIL